MNGSTKQAFHVNQKGPVGLGFNLKREKRLWHRNVKRMPNGPFCTEAGIVGLVTGQEELGQVSFDHKGLVT